uniref:DUF4228 domain-containing protein n=1 Tax=Ananas comosus var. bracteatus TaxID=296719 RepID=A0A6V7PRE8_ANACO|nr:unnamed protein product [Ananas comosus var. bracteatus]
MGNGLAPCFAPRSHSGTVKLVFWGGGGASESLLPPRDRPLLAGELMFEFPDRVLCRADAFYVGRPFPILSFDDALLPGHTYFVLPLDRLRPPSAVVTVASLASLSPAGLPVEFAGAQCRPFEYVRGHDGRMAIKVVPEFIARVITAGGQEGSDRRHETAAAATPLCSTPELQKHYAQLVGLARERPWSPQLETIKEVTNSTIFSKNQTNRKYFFRQKTR